MFVDYYALLNIDEEAELKMIKRAYKREASIWHPDKNRGKDTNERMQLINAAYLILSDSEAKMFYDIEYKQFKKIYSSEKKIKNETQYSTNENTFHSKYTYNYTVKNEKLARWIDNAMRQGLDLLKDTYSMTSGGIKEATKGAIQLIGCQIIIALIIVVFAIIWSLGKSF